jgi:hypothetical protein
MKIPAACAIVWAINGNGLVYVPKNENSSTEEAISDEGMIKPISIKRITSEKIKQHNEKELS